MDVTPLFAGLGAGLSLIAAIGAQNAFVLRQGIRREHLWLVVLVCTLSDAVLIFGGVAGIGALLLSAPWIMVAARVGGAVFLLSYAAMALRRAVRPGVLRAEDPAGAATSRSAVLLTALALTWLNPHVYLDTVILLGSIAAAQGETGRWFFAMGAVLGSAIWFPLLAFGARALRGFFGRPSSWRVLDAVVATVMATIAITLLAGL